MNMTPSICSADRLDYVGAQFGLKYLDNYGNPEGCVALYVEDDESWHLVTTFNKLWLNDLIRAGYQAKRYFGVK